MMFNELNKKEKPFVGFAAYGGGATGLMAAGGSGAKTYVDDVFSNYLYTGTGSGNSPNPINLGIDMATEGGLTWIKYRDGAFGSGHYLYDTARSNASLKSNLQDQQNPSDDRLDFTSTGFSVKNDGGDGTNANGYDYASWSFRKAPGFFDIVTFNGTGSAQNIPHNLGSVPGMILIKCTSHSSDWSVYHRSLSATRNMHLNNDSLADTQTGVFNDTEPTSTQFTVNYDGDVNGDGKTYVAYLFAHDEQTFGTGGNEAIIKCGSYTGNSSTTGPEINLGFEPQFVMVKLAVDTDGLSGPWIIQDAMRNGRSSENVTYGLSADTSNGESSTAPNLGVTATGFQPRSTSNYVNANGDTYIYVAIRRPNKPPEAATDVFAIDTAGATSPTPPLYTSGFPADFQMRFDTNSGNRVWHSRLQGIYSMSPAGTAPESSASSLIWDYQNGWSSGTSVESNVYSYMFRRAPSFMDVVSYAGDSNSSRQIAHNLTVKPEMVIIKNSTYSSGTNWTVWHKDMFDTTIQLNASDAWANGGPSSTYGGSGSGTATGGSLNGSTDTYFKPGNAFTENSNGERYISYHFATLSGISKVGSYDGSSSNVNVDCGFSSGARFVLIKRVDAIGDWCVFDTSRGINAGNDPVMKIGGGAQDTGNDLIDPYSSGFTVVGGNSFINNGNAGAKYIYLAIA